MGAFILTLLIIGPDRISAAPAVAASTQEYNSEKACNDAKNAIREAVRADQTRSASGTIIAVCSSK